MKRFRASVITSFIACGLLFLNLGSFVFSDPANVSVAAAAPVNDDSQSDARDPVTASTGANIRTSRTAPASRGDDRARKISPAYLPTPVPRYFSLTWHLVERAAAPPRAPAFRA